MAPLNGEYHYEHHMVPAMPYYNAPRLRQILEAKGFAVPLANGYCAFIWNKWLVERDLERCAQAT
jgi:fatty acid desaturase